MAQSPSHPAGSAIPSPERLALSALSRVLASPDLGALLSSAKSELRNAIVDDPLDALLVTCLGGAWLFYVAEKDDNPKINSFWDSLVFVTTSLSVGYANMFAVTNSGKAIASVLMTIGPAMAAKALELPRAQSEVAEREAAEALARDTAAKVALTERLDALVTKLDALATR
jgi:hypothetical protein